MFVVAFVSLGCALLLALFGLYLFFPGHALRMMGRDPLEPEVLPFTKGWVRTVGFVGVVFVVVWGIGLLLHAVR